MAHAHAAESPITHDVWIDRGGTFTDCLVRDRATGQVSETKVLSGESSPLDAIRQALGRGATDPLPTCAVRLGTTVATNALLERTGARTVLISNTGLGDLLALGDQTRPALFDLHEPRQPSLAHLTLTTDARVDAAGRELVPLTDADLADLAGQLRASGAEAVAAALIHAHVAPDHERRLAGVTPLPVVCSHEVSGARGLLARTMTAVLDAYLAPVLAGRFEALAAALPAGSSLALLQSSGDLAPLQRAAGRSVVLSGPAGGALACHAIAQRLGMPVLGLDMGGTSTDVCRVGLEGPEVQAESVVAGVQVRAPSIVIHTIAAGGGSICRFDAASLGRYVVGPGSVGADPGPLCYGRDDARDAALTDVAVVLGRIPEDALPIPIDPARALAGVAALDPTRAAIDVAAGFYEVAVQSMANAIEEVSTQRGHDPREHALVAFGGAGGQYACAVAERLGIDQVVFPPLAGALSAWGISGARAGWTAERACPGALDAETVRAASRVAEELRALAPLEGDAEVWLALRHEGTEEFFEVPLETGAPDQLRRRFDDAHRRRHGFIRSLPVVASHVRVSVRAAGAVAPVNLADGPLRSTREHVMVVGGRPRSVPLVDRAAVEDGARGPLVFVDRTATYVVDHGWTLRRRHGLLVAERDAAPPDVADDLREPDDDPVLLSVMIERFKSIAERMGVRLRRTASSANMRDRLDFSCALFDGAGQLVANAPHIPVHLGAMGASVRAMIERFGTGMQDGDAFVTNDPRAGGSHLPDLTVVTPVLVGDQRFFVACRGHHADIGGIVPGSMPAESHDLAEEGVLFEGLQVMRAGTPQLDAFERGLREAPHPARRPAENVADLEAQLAACALGRRELHALCERYGAPAVAHQMARSMDAAERALRAAIAELPDGVRQCEDALDDGTPIVARVEVRGDQLVIDFAGTGGVHPGNLNAPPAVTRACALYALRVLLGDTRAPLNEGFARALDLRIPRACLLDPFDDAAASPAVAGGNVETSQRVVDVILAALLDQAAGQGTMNNLTLGDDTFGYYETIAGGGGAGPGGAGIDAAQVHMTNSRITDPEVLEASFPLRLVRFEVRRGSGGGGTHRGGDGVVREIEALRAVRGSLVAERRRRAPFGRSGGQPGAPGRDALVRADGREDTIAGHARFELSPGDRIRVVTPGGGGWGLAHE